MFSVVVFVVLKININELSRKKVIIVISIVSLVLRLNWIKSAVSVFVLINDFIISVSAILKFNGCVGTIVFNVFRLFMSLIVSYME